jgi:predicted O-methyltransferase YrrM
LRHRAADQSKALQTLRDDVAHLSQRLDDTRADMRAWERRQRRDLLTVGDMAAAQSSAAFFRREMGAATTHFSEVDALTAAMKATLVPGLFLEFGVASGGTLRTIAEYAPAGTVFGFDSFEGLPEHWRSGYDAGQFAQEQLPEVPGAELVVGWFDATLPGFLEQHREPVAFLHLDADLYSSTKVLLDLLQPRLRPGTVILFDEYFDDPGWEEHEHRAWTEFVARTGIEFEYLGLTADDEQVSMRPTLVPVQEGWGTGSTTRSRSRRRTAQTGVPVIAGSHAGWSRVVPCAARGQPVAPRHTAATGSQPGFLEATTRDRGTADQRPYPHRRDSPPGDQRGRQRVPDGPRWREETRPAGEHVS